MTETTPDLQAICEEVEAEWEMVGLSSDGGLYSDYAKEVARRFAALVRAQVIEEAAQKCSVLAQERETDYVTNFDCADALRGMKSDSGDSATADAGASTAPLPEVPARVEAMFATMHRFLEWNRADARHSEPPVRVGYEYGVFEQAVKMWEAAAPKEPARWIPVSERLPEIGTDCIVFKTSPWVDGPYIAFDRWDEQYEAPVSFSSATIPIGPGWGEAEFDDVTHWMPKPDAPRCRSADTARHGSDVQAESASPSVLLIRGEK